MHAERTVDVSHARLTDVIAGIPGLIEDAVSALVTYEGHDGILRTENWIETMIQGLVKKALTKSLDPSNSIVNSSAKLRA